MYLLSDYNSAEFARRQGSKDIKVRKKRTLEGFVQKGVVIGSGLTTTGALIGIGLSKKAGIPISLKGAAERIVDRSLAGVGLGATTGAAIYGTRRLLAKDKQKFNSGH